MQRVLVIGCPGAGKSTFSRKLRDATGLPLFYLDRIWHRPDRTTVPREVFDKKLREILAKETWILDGNYQRTMGMRLARCDTVFFLDYPPEVCLDGAQARVGQPREDMPWTETVLDPELRQMIDTFGEIQAPEIYRLLEQYCNLLQIHIFKSRDVAEAYLRNLSCL